MSATAEVIEIKQFQKKVKTLRELYPFVLGNIPRELFWRGFSRRQKQIVQIVKKNSTCTAAEVLKAMRVAFGLADEEAAGALSDLNDLIAQKVVRQDTFDPDQSEWDISCQTVVARTSDAQDIGRRQKAEEIFGQIANMQSKRVRETGVKYAAVWVTHQLGIPRDKVSALLKRPNNNYVEKALGKIQAGEFPVDLNKDFLEDACRRFGVEMP